MLQTVAGALFGLLIFVGVVLEFFWACPCGKTCFKNRKRNVNIARVAIVLGIVIIGSSLEL